AGLPPAFNGDVGGEAAEPVGAVGSKDAGFCADVGERAVAVVVIKDILAAVEAGRAASDCDALVKTRAGFRNGRGFQIKINVVGNEQIEVAVTIVVHKGAAGVPALACARKAGFFADFAERAVAVVVIENVFTEVRDEEVLEAVVVVVTNTDTLAPAGVEESGL